MVLLCPIPQHRTDIGIVVRYWGQSELGWTSYRREEEVFIPRRVFLIPNHVTNQKLRMGYAQTGLRTHAFFHSSISIKVFSLRHTGLMLAYFDFLRQPNSPKTFFQVWVLKHDKVPFPITANLSRETAQPTTSRG